MQTDLLTMNSIRLMQRVHRGDYDVRRMARGMPVSSERTKYRLIDPRVASAFVCIHNVVAYITTRLLVQRDVRIGFNSTISLLKARRILS